MRALILLLLCLAPTTEGFAPSPRAKLPNVPLQQQNNANYRLLHRETTTRLLYGNDTVAEPTTTTASSPLDRFNRQASNIRHVDEPCILTIHQRRYNMTAWANSHPGGAKILLRFHDKNATKAFEAAHHSDEAYAMLEHFEIKEEETVANAAVPNGSPKTLSWRRRARKKLFTKEDPIGVHKYLGIFCLLNFMGRYTQMLFGDPAAGLGTRGHAWFSMACLIPHAMLSLSSLIFHTVPRERVSLIPTIWKEYRAHNIIFGVRSVLTAMIAALAIKARNTPTARSLAIVASGACVLLANWGADEATEKLRAVEVESTTATMRKFLQKRNGEGLCSRLQKIHSNHFLLFPSQPTGKDALSKHNGDSSLFMRIASSWPRWHAWYVGTRLGRWLYCSPFNWPACS